MLLLKQVGWPSGPRFFSWLFLGKAFFEKQRAA
jgi:hypothetical protein